jgi:hypothetical protein
MFAVVITTFPEKVKKPPILTLSRSNSEPASYCGRESAVKSGTTGQSFFHAGLRPGCGSPVEKAISKMGDQ